LNIRRIQDLIEAGRVGGQGVNLTKKGVNLKFSYFYVHFFPMIPDGYLKGITGKNSPHDAISNNGVPAHFIF
jgi:hypothetical protein